MHNNYKTVHHDHDRCKMLLQNTTNAGFVSAVYYSAHRQGDGTWVPANECPFDKDTGRLLAFVAHNGHGLYPTAGVNPRVFLVANDVTSDKGRVWACQECHILEHPGKWLTKGKVELRKIPAVCDRGAVYVDAFDDSELKEYTGTIDAGDDAPVSRQYIEVGHGSLQLICSKLSHILRYH